MKKLLVGLLCLGAAQSAHAFDSAQQLQAKCVLGLSLTKQNASDPKFIVAFGQCESFILGALYGSLSTASFIQRAAKASRKELDPLIATAIALKTARPCVGADVTARDMAMEIALKIATTDYLPKDMAANAVRDAWFAAFPCKK